MPKNTKPPPTPIPAAQYVRMSDDLQQFSIENQKAAIQDYASRHGFVIVRTYADAGKSGVVAKSRTGLSDLLKDVVNGNPGYKAILVYDVSRWGRFPNNDEAAHYEFLCSSSGVPLHYCAEQFANDGTASSSILKALKRSMAAEFSRELSDKVFVGKSRIVRLGFRVGGSAGFGLKRLLISADGKRKQVLEYGDRKSLTTDRVILIPGPSGEVKRVREMFSMALEGLGCTAIARELNRTGKFKPTGKPWYCRDIYNIVTNPKYSGCNVWYRGTQRLHTKRSAVEPQNWIQKPDSFDPIIDAKTFEQAQASLPRRADSFWSDAEILRKLRRLLASKGYLSESLILRTPGMPVPYTLHRHFGSYRQLYKAVGYQLPDQDLYRGERAELSMRLRRKLVKQISELFPEHVRITKLPNRDRSVLEIDHSFLVSILISVSIQPVGQRLYWRIAPCPAERQNITLLCRVNTARTRIESYHLLPNANIPEKVCSSFEHASFLRNGIALRGISGFYSAVETLRARIFSNEK